MGARLQYGLFELSQSKYFAMLVRSFDTVLCAIKHTSSYFAMSFCVATNVVSRQVPLSSLIANDHGEFASRERFALTGVDNLVLAELGKYLLNDSPCVARLRLHGKLMGAAPGDLRHLPQPRDPRSQGLCECR